MNKTLLVKERRLVLAKELSIAENKLDFIGTIDNSKYNIPTLLYFNVTDPKHPKYKSTVAIRKNEE
jgi:hypothetical protein